MTDSRWLIRPVDSDQAHRLAETLGVSPAAARVLIGRGYAEPAAARRFLRPALADLYDPGRMLGMAAALARLRRAVAAREKILLYGDYDVDGTTAVVILKTALELAGGQAGYHIPHRLKDGYGMQAEVFEQAAAEGVTLVVSVDTGIRATEVVLRARELGIDVIVTDHHPPDAVLPPALAVLNPKQPGCPYPEKNLCGVGVAFKLVQALLASLDWPAEKLARMTRSFLKLVAIGTVADVVPLTGENRVMVKHGLAELRVVRQPGLRALLEVAGLAPGEVPSAGQVAFRIAPRLNAAGRMAEAGRVIQLLLTSDEAEARRIAGELHALNAERQQTESDIVRIILEACLLLPVTARQTALVFSGRDWHRGVLGIVATRLVERFHRPVFVLSEEAETGLAQGSGRSIPSFDLLAALDSMAGLFTRFGGHRQAAGVSLPLERVEEFRDRLNAYAAARLAPEDFCPQIEVDAEVELADLTEEFAAEIFSMAPFGFGNPTPVFLVRGLEVASPPVVFKERHLRVTLRQGERGLAAKAFDFAARLPELVPGARLDVALHLEPDDWSAARGLPPWSAVLRDLRPA